MSAKRPANSIHGDQIGGRRLILLGATFGVLTGLGEAALRGVQVLTGARTFLSAHVVWMAPLADLVLFTAIAGLLALMWLPRAATGPRRETAIALFVFLAVVGPALQYPRLHWAASIVLCAGLARLVAPVLNRFAERRVGQTFRAASAVVLVSTVAVIGTGWLAARSRGPDGVATASAPNVILLVLDTVRSENLGPYGYALPTTPHLDRMAQNAVVFERAYSTAPWTLPAHASMFTGRYPWGSSADWSVALDDRDLTLAEWFSRRGYNTGGFAANLLYTTRDMGLDRGFHRYEDFPVSVGMVIRSSLLARTLARRARSGSGRPLVHVTAAEINDRFLRWVDGVEGPFFAFLNYMDAHAPYLPPPGYAERFGPTREGPAMADLSLRSDWTDAELAAERAAYDGAIAYLDEQIDRLLASLEERGALDQTIIVITSDHGELFGEKGLVDHGNSLYRPVLEVPLIVRYPARAPGGVRIGRPVSIRDVPSTIADLAGGELASGDPAFPGHSLAALWADSTGASVSSAVLAQVSSGVRMPEWTPIARGDMSALVDDGAHYIENGDGVEELYALDDRPQTDDVSGREPELLETLRVRTDSLNASLPERGR